MTDFTEARKKFDLEPDVNPAAGVYIGLNTAIMTSLFFKEVASGC